MPCDRQIVHKLGSSPRRRGGRPAGSRGSWAAGVIPAQAGRTKPGRSTPKVSWGHPRAGGADLGLIMVAPSTLGSSPRRRGGRPSCHRELVPAGVIPAQAGRTCWCRWSRLLRWGHPRAGGADVFLHLSTLSGGGSSPRRRGGRWPDGEGPGRCGVIPAQAGRTNSSTTTTDSYWGHPRAGGADRYLTRDVGGPPGSSPRRRGGPAHFPPANWRRGVIPAQAGRTRAARGTLPSVRGHPRAGGADRRRL